jgi:AAA15 family ATPase/GTPase
MLLTFTLKNFRSFEDVQTLRLMHGAREQSEGMLHPDVVPALAIMGGNASGKSNLLRGLGLMFEMIRSSASRPDESLPYEPFLLGESEDPGSTLFEVTVRLDDVLYNYGFEYDRSSIVAEWLYASPHGRQRTLFERGVGERDWYFGDSLSGPTQTMAEATRADALFLSTARLLNHRTLTPLQEQLGNLVRNLGPDTLPVLLQQTLESLENDPARLHRVTRFLKRSDLGVEKLSVEKNPWPAGLQEAALQFLQSSMPEATVEDLQSDLNWSSLQPRLTHRASNKRLVELPFEWESVGTRNMLALLGPILDQLMVGGVLVVDELDTSLHPRLVSAIVKLFVNPKTNPKHAQLILSTHDVTVMMNVSGYSALGRDELWLVEKNQYTGSSRLYSIWEHQPRKGEVLSRNYLVGSYGALPRIDETNFSDIFEWDAEDFRDPDAETDL